MKTDIEIAQAAKIRNISEIAEKVGVPAESYSPYGHFKAKVDYGYKSGKGEGKVVLVTAISPTPAGEGKTTTTVGLGDALCKIGKNAVICLREPSLGPVFGVKGGAAGGGYAQVIPMEDINLHFTGDLHAITAAHNLLAAMLDNHIQQGNALKIDTRRVVYRRAIDMNDRQLRGMVNGLGGKTNGTPREDGFDITAASEVMAVFCLSESISDLKKNLANIVVAYNFDGEPVRAGDLNAAGAMAALLKEAFNPNLVQTLEGTPAIIHGGPFANIAHGCNSVRATKLALKLADIAVTEAGFGADLGAEKFFNIKCRKSGLKPDAAVLVATVRALKYNGGVERNDLGAPCVESVEKGIVNLEKHIQNLQKFGVPVVVALNKFSTDSAEELGAVKACVEGMGAAFALSEVWEKGGEGGLELAKAVVDILETKQSDFKLLYDDNTSVKAKIETVCKQIYGAGSVVFADRAKNNIARIKRLGLTHLPVCMAKTQYSLSDNPALLGRPEGFKITVREIKISAGAGFLVALTGDIMTMPGLPKVPSAEGIDVVDGEVRGLF